jgi:hypothetical protein
VLSQKILEAVFGDQAVRQLAADARADLRRRVEGLLGEEEARYIALLVAHDVDAKAPARLEQALAEVQEARAEFAAAEQAEEKGETGTQPGGENDKPEGEAEKTPEGEKA